MWEVIKARDPVHNNADPHLVPGVLLSRRVDGCNVIVSYYKEGGKAHCLSLLLIYLIRQGH